MKKCVSAFLAVLMILSFSACAGIKPLPHDHDFDEYGFCRGCGAPTEERQKDLDAVVKAVCFLFWYVNYDGQSPHSDDMEITYSAIEENPEDHSCHVAGSLTAPHDGRYYKGDFSMQCKWDAENGKYVHDSGKFDEFYASGGNGNKLTFTFPTACEFTHYRNSARVSVLIFEHSGAMKQYIYSYSGSLVSVNDATYSISYTPICQVITVTASNGNVSTAYYYPDQKGMMFNDDAYIATSYHDDPVRPTPDYPSDTDLPSTSEY